MAKAEHLRKYCFNAETARAARLAQPVAPRTMHGLTEVVRGGKRRCHPPKCIKAHCCSAARLPDDRRPQHCLALERHLRACELSLRRTLPVTPGVNAALLGIILRREQLIAIAGWWLSETEPFERGEDGRLTAQAVVEQYRGLLREQARDLQALGARRDFDRPAPDAVFARALHAAIDPTLGQQDAPVGPQNGSGGDEDANG